jgi:nicotinate-nucleotide--dimethylbenzimidazole phosphoribosyltransferase
LLLTPPGSLGALDRALDKLVALGITAEAHAQLVVVAADHPVTRHRVSVYPASVTREVLEATVAGESFGAAAAKAAGLDVVAVDAGVEGPPVPGSVDLRRGGPRGDLAAEDAMSEEATCALVEAGRELGKSLAGALVAVGEVGVGNTTVAAALAAALLGLAPARAVGLGAGGDSATLERKKAVVETALSRVSSRLGGKRARQSPLEALAALGGPEVAVLTGTVLGVAERGGAVVLDGLATSVAALCAALLEPAVAAHLVAGQRSREQAHLAVLTDAGLEPLLDLRIRAGEGVGATLACQLLRTGLHLRSLAGKVAP